MGASIFNYIPKLIILIILQAATANLSYAGEEVSVTLLLSGKKDVYKEFVDSFIGFYESKKSSGIRLIINVKYPEDYMSSMIIARKDAREVFVAVGVKAAEKLYEQKLNVPVIYSMIPFSRYRDPVAGFDCLAQTAVYLDQPVYRQIMLSSIIFPESKTYGLLLGPQSKSRFEKERNIESLVSDGLTFKYVDEDEKFVRLLSDMSDNVDVFLAVNDPVIMSASNAKWLIYVAYQYQKPVIGFSGSYVSAGAAASVYTTSSHIAKQTLKMIINLDGENKMCLPDPQYPDDFEVAINKSIIKSLSGRVIKENEIHNIIKQKENSR